MGPRGRTDGPQRASAELRDLVHRLAPRALSEGGLRAGLGALVSAVPATAYPRVRLEVDCPRIVARVETAGYFIDAEGLSNALKHAEATYISVSARVCEGHLLVEVADDGVGGADPNRGTGLLGLTERAAAAGGTLAVSARRPGGTLLRAELPIPKMTTP